MPLVAIGTLLLIAHLADLGPVGHWPWWVIAAPFAGAVLWWSFADNSGWTQRRVMDQMERKKAERRAKALDALGLTPGRDRQGPAARKDRPRDTAPPAVPSEPPPRRDPRL